MEIDKSIFYVLNPNAKIYKHAIEIPPYHCNNIVIKWHPDTNPKYMQLTKEVNQWLDENITNDWLYIEPLTQIKFIDKEDAFAFILRWS